MAEPRPILIRPATVADVAIVAAHRVGMFRDMGSAPPSAFDAIRLATIDFLQDAIPRGAYRGWLAAPAQDPATIVAGAGVQPRRVLPYPRRRPDGGADVVAGRQAIVLNVYTEPAFRRQGIARRLMHQVLAWARDAGIESLVLHAAPDGRALYESLGFKATNEMRYQGDLAAWTAPVA